MRVSDGAGGMRPLEDHRFGPGRWQVSATIPAVEGEAFFAYLDLEIRTRGWNAGSLTQLTSEANSGSMTIYLSPGQAVSTIEVAWDKKRNRELRIQARPGGDPPTSPALLDEFFGAVTARHNERRLDRAHRRYWLAYDGLPWAGELWLTDDLRLGPPSKSEPVQIGRRIVIVDAMPEGIGDAGITAQFARVMREVRLVLSPIVGVHFEVVPQWASEWVPEIDDRQLVVDCRLRPVGYTEVGLPNRMPVRGEILPSTRETVARPGLGRFGIWPDDHSVRVPTDLEALWAAFQALPPDRKEHYLRACNAYHNARAMWPDQRTAYAMFLVVACEALKPSGHRHDAANIYDVVASLSGRADAEALRNLELAPQSVRSKHVHRGVLTAGEEPSLLFGDPFRDPSFDDTLMALSRVTRMCLIEWLRHGGDYRLTRLPRR